MAYAIEQYIHTLIPVDSNYTAKPAQVEAFFTDLLRLPNFRLIADPPFQQGLRISKPFAKVRSIENRITGKTKTFRAPEFTKVDAPNAITPLIESLDDFGVSASGEWRWDDPPLVLYTTDDEQFKENYNCEVRCEQRAMLISTSAWDEEAGPNVRNVPQFGEPYSPTDDTGVFTNPWTGDAVEVPNAGCARFWIEFEFGKFIFPRVDKNFDVLNPSIVREAEQCFQTKFVQGCHFW